MILTFHVSPLASGQGLCVTVIDHRGGLSELYYRVKVVYKSMSHGP